jgi:hypothetical protein
MRFVLLVEDISLMYLMNDQQVVTIADCSANGAMVQVPRFELGQELSHQILSLARLPVPPYLRLIILTYTFYHHL